MLVYVLSKSYIVQLDINCFVYHGSEATSSLLYTPSAIVSEDFYRAGFPTVKAFTK